MKTRASCSSLFGIVVVAIGLGYPLAALASMAESSEDRYIFSPREVPIAELIGYWTKQKLKRPLTPDEGVILRLAEFSQSIGIKSFAVSHEEDKTDEKGWAAATREQIGFKLEWYVRGKRLWDFPIPAGALTELKRERAEFQSMIGADRYTWAWALNQLGEKAESKKLLSSLFDREYARVMKLQETSTLDMIEFESLSTPLKKMSDKAEAAEIDAKLKQMKLHISNLPSHEIMT